MTSTSTRSCSGRRGRNTDEGARPRRRRGWLGAETLKLPLPAEQGFGVGFPRSVSVSSIVHNATLIEDKQGAPMSDISADLQRELDELQAAYKVAVDAWVNGIREEEALASGNHSVAELDKWEAAHFREHKLHKEADYRKRLYEDALRREFYGF